MTKDMTPAETPSSARQVATERARQIPRTLAYYAAFVALGLTAAALGPTLPGLAEQTHTRLSEISLLFAARSLGYLVGSLIGGRLVDRVPGHPLLAGMLVVMAAMLGLVPLVPLLWLLVAILLALGAAESALDVGGNTLLVWTHGDRVGPFMNGLHFCFGLGAFLSPVLIAQAVLVAGGFSWAYWLLALAMPPVALWLLLLPGPRQPATSGDGPGSQAHRRLAVLIASFFFLYVGAEVSFGGWIFTYALAMDLTGAVAAAYLTSAFWGMLTLGRLLAVPVAARVRPSRILLASLLGCLASASVLLVWSHGPTALWLGTLGMGLSMAAIFPTTISLAERRMPITGRVTGWFLVGASAGGMFLPWLIGQLFESVGPRSTPFSIMLDMAVALGVLALLLRHSSRRLVPGKARTGA